ncbi:MAG: hypothetical protein ACOCZ5_01805 [bacterium]
MALTQDIRDELQLLLKDLIPQLNKLTIQYMTQNDLKSSSNLVKSVEYDVDDSGIQLVANNYWYYASQGRRARTRKVPIRALIDYIKRYGIRPRGNQTINQLAFAIQTSIYKQGINPKNYAQKVIDATADLTEQTVLNELSEDIADEIIKQLQTKS